MSGVAGGLITEDRAGQPGDIPRGFAARHAEDANWIVEPSFADTLLSGAGLRWSKWQEQGALEVIKTGPHRTVHRLDLPEGEFYIKRFRIADWKALLQNVVRACKAELEWRAARRIAALGLPTFETAALGRCVQSGVVRENYLISRGIPNAVPLDRFLQTDFLQHSHESQPRLRQRLARALGQLAARLHKAGIEHSDFHAGNLLIRLEPAGMPALFLIDLHAVRFRRTLSKDARTRNLALLNRFFALRATRTDRLRFFRAYFVEYSAAAPTFDEIERLEMACNRSAHAGWQRADRAWKRGNRHVRKLDHGAIRCRGLATLDAAWLTEIRDAPESLFTERIVDWCKRSGRHRVAAVKLPSPGGLLRAYWKCIEHRGWLGRYLARVRESAVRLAWETGHAFLRRGIATPQPLLYVEAESQDFRRDYLLTAEIANSTTLADFCINMFPKLSARQQRNWGCGVLRQLASQMRRLHDCRFDHRDLKFQNILVSRNADDHKTWLLDLDAVRTWPWPSARRAVQNLSRLNVSSLTHQVFRNADRLRFLKWYLGDRFQLEWKWWWQRIACRSLKKQQQNQRRGRPLS